jgi:hypothetical protein
MFFKPTRYKDSERESTNLKERKVIVLKRYLARLLCLSLLTSECITSAGYTPGGKIHISEQVRIGNNQGWAECWVTKSGGGGFGDGDFILIARKLDNLRVISIDTLFKSHVSEQDSIAFILDIAPEDSLADLLLQGKTIDVYGNIINRMVDSVRVSVVKHNRVKKLNKGGVR